MELIKHFRSLFLRHGRHMLLYFGFVWFYFEYLSSLGEIKHASGVFIASWD